MDFAKNLDESPKINDISTQKRDKNENASQNQLTGI